jgi:microcystin-dependent protein
VGETGCLERVTLTASELPSHSHLLFASANGATSTDPTGSVPAQSNQVAAYSADLVVGDRFALCLFSMLV